jgi:hypothetical protein
MMARLSAPSAAFAPFSTTRLPPDSFTDHAFHPRKITSVPLLPNATTTRASAA